MTPLTRPIEWVAGKGTAMAGGCLAAGALLIWLSATVWGVTLGGSGSAGWLVLGTLLGPALAALGAFLAATGAACLLRPRGLLDPESRRLLDDAARHHASGSLSPEGFQATRERLHAHAARRSAPQVALALSLLGASLAVLAFSLIGAALGVQGSLGGLGSASAAGTRTVFGTLGACAVVVLASLAVVLPQASRWRARARAEASALQQMLADLESDILDEVRRAATAPVEAEPDS